MTLSARSIGINISLLLVGTAFARILSAFTQILIARLIAPASFGQYAAALALAKILSVAFSLGLDVWLLRNGVGETEPEQFSKQVTSCFAIKLLLGLFWLGSFYLLTFLLPEDLFPPVLLLPIAAVVWVEELLATVQSAFKSLLKNAQSALLIIASQMLLVVITLLIAQGSDLTALPFVIGRLAASLVVLVGGVQLLRKNVSIRLDLAYAQQVGKQSAVFGLSILFAQIYGQADVTLVAFWLDKHTAGLYSLAVTIISTLFLIPAAGHDVLLPMVQRIYYKSRSLPLRLASQLLVVAGLVGITLTLATAFLARFGVDLLYGVSFAATSRLLMILSVLLFFKCITFALAVLITVVGWQPMRVWIQGGAALFNLCLNLLVINTWGITGVAIVYVLTECLLSVAYAALVRSWYRQAGAMANL